MSSQPPSDLAAATAVAAAEPRWAPTGRTIGLICLAGVLVVGQLYVVLPLLDDLAREWGATRSAVTWTTTCFGLAYALGFLVTGPLSDRWGRRPVIVGGLLATSVTTLFVALAPSLELGLAARIAQGATASLFAPAAFAYLAEHIEPRRRVLALTCLTSSFLAAGVIAQVASQAVAAAWGPSAIFLLSSVGFVLVGAAAWFVLQPRAPAAAPRANEPRGLRGSFGPFVALLRNPLLALLFASCVSVLGVFVGLYTGIQLSPPDGIGEGAMLALRASALPAMIAVPLLAGRLAGVAPTTRVVSALLAAAITAAATIVPLGGVWVALCLLFFVAAIAVAAPALVQAIAERAGTARGAATSLYTFTLFLGASAGPQLANLLAGVGYGAVAGAMAAVALAGAGLAYVSTRVG
ncbi:MFS transporter [Rhodococcus sp. NPDC055112]